MSPICEKLGKLNCKIELRVKVKWKSYLTLAHFTIIIIINRVNFQRNFDFVTKINICLIHFVKVMFFWVLWWRQWIRFDVIIMLIVKLYCAYYYEMGTLRYDIQQQHTTYHIQRIHVHNPVLILIKSSIDNIT